MSQSRFIRQPLELVVARYDRIEPWSDLARLSPSAQVERFQFDLYFICTARKQ